MGVGGPFSRADVGATAVCNLVPVLQDSAVRMEGKSSFVRGLRLRESIGGTVVEPSSNDK